MNAQELLIGLCSIIGGLSCTVGPKNQFPLPATSEYQIELETVARGGDDDFFWTQARAAWVPVDTPYALMTLSQKLKTGSDVYYDLYQTVSYDTGQTWTKPQVIPPLRIHDIGDGYRRSMSDMTPRWHQATQKVLNIGKSFFYTDDSTPDRSRRQVAYAVYDPATQAWGKYRELELPVLDHDSLQLSAPVAGCVQWLELPNGEVLIPIFYYKLTPDQAATIGRETFDVENFMQSDGLGHVTTVVRCQFDGENLTYLEHGDELRLTSGRGIYEPSVAHFAGEYFITLRADKTAYVAKSDDGLHYEPMQEWKFDDGAVLGSYNTQQHWAIYQDQLYLVYTRRGANNDEVFRHRAPLLMAEVDPSTLTVRRSTERVVVPNRGVGLGNFGVTDINENQVWITTTEYMRDETNVAADNSVFVARVLKK